LTAEDIENGQFRAMCKPGDGMRATYLPKDLNDFVYYPCNQNQTAIIPAPAGDTLLTTAIKSRNAGGKTDGDTGTIF
jgi:hypothetical protein